MDERLKKLKHSVFCQIVIFLVAQFKRKSIFNKFVGRCTIYAISKIFTHLYYGPCHSIVRIIRAWLSEKYQMCEPGNWKDNRSH